MLVYFDESYDSNRDYLILSALFCPKPKQLHSGMMEIKRRLGYVDVDGKPLEIKYSITNNRNRYRVARECVNLFRDSSARFRSIVIETGDNTFDIDRFGRTYEKDAIKMARAYKKFAEMLLSHNTAAIEDAVLLTDRLTRTRGDLFLELMRENFCHPGIAFSSGKERPTFKHIQGVDTALPSYQVGQIGDLLMGSVLNALKPTQNQWKTRLRMHVQRELKLQSLEAEYWQKMSKARAELVHPKFRAWFWRPAGD